MPESFEPIRVDLTERAVVLPETLPWVSSSTLGVARVRLERAGENARATSLVRCAPHAAFSKHTHGGGEEIFVLEGLFIDERAHYRAGTYLRNPVGSHHAPYAGPEGATLFVRLHQSSRADQTRVVIDTASATLLPGAAPGLTVLPLHDFGEEHVALVRWEPNTRFRHHSHWGGEEILVLEGVFRDEHGSYPRGSWIRSPHLSTHAPFTESEGATILVKTGHLPSVSG